MATGTVKWFNQQKGYGFIQPETGGKDVFVHISAVEKAGFTGLAEGAKVSYEIVANRGKESAENLRLASELSRMYARHAMWMARAMFRAICFSGMWFFNNPAQFRVFLSFRNWGLLPTARLALDQNVLLHCFRLTPD